MSRFTCMPGDAALGRRAMLTGASALIALGASARAAEAAALIDLVDADGQAVARAAALAGRQVRVVGYLAPSFDPGNPDWLLTESPAMPCQLCGSGHDDGPAVAVRPTDVPNLSPVQAVAVTGLVEVAGGVPRLIDARVEAI
jgi:hypothetical protein